MFHCWYDFFNRCLDHASSNLIKIIRKIPEELGELEPAIISELFERAIMLRQHSLLYLSNEPSSGA